MNRIRAGQAMLRLAGLALVALGALLAFSRDSSFLLGVFQGASGPGFAGQNTESFFMWLVGFLGASLIAWGFLLFGLAYELQKTGSRRTWICIFASLILWGTLSSVLTLTHNLYRDAAVTAVFALGSIVAMLLTRPKQESEVNIAILAATTEDAAELVSLQRLAFRSEALIVGDQGIQPMMETLEDMEAAFSTHKIWKYVEEGKIIASVRTRTENQICSVGRILVRPDKQGRGIGKFLLSFVEASERDAQAFRLFTSSASERNLKFYAGAGYRELERTPGGEHYQIVHMEKIRSPRTGRPS